ncbi:hypothetical protein ACTFXU_21390, partial [Pseudomonas aeruginosa]
PSVLSLDKALHWRPPLILNPSNHSKDDANVFTRSGPEMDGYTLTAEIRSDPRLQKLHILLHTSLSGVFNQAMVKKVGADDFLAKFRPDDLAARVVERIKAVDAG